MALMRGNWVEAIPIIHTGSNHVLTTKLKNMILVKENKGFAVYFDSNSQTYSVTKDGKFLIGNKYKFSQVKSYLD
ncbi:MAG: hypothetical protein RL728_445 [Bacteroidota bacterium]|jgi:hypothetical protein